MRHIPTIITFVGGCATLAPYATLAPLSPTVIVNIILVFVNMNDGNRDSELRSKHWKLTNIALGY